METENKYQRGKIYKIISSQTHDVYYGSTVEDRLTNRLSNHRNQYKRWLEGKIGYITSFEIVKYNDAKIILQENFPCNTKYELVAREQYYIDSNECVNKHKAYTELSMKEYKSEYHQKNKEKHALQSKLYYDNHKDEIKDYKKKYQEEHADELKERSKQYRKENAEKIKEAKKKYYNEHFDEIKEKAMKHQKEHTEERREYMKQYQKENADKIKEYKKQYYKEHIKTLNDIITCECGSSVVKYTLKTHEKTKKHQTFLKEHPTEE